MENTIRTNVRTVKHFSQGVQLDAKSTGTVRVVSFILFNRKT